MNWTGLGLTLFGGAIGSFFTHAFHIRTNQLKGIQGTLDALHIKTSQVQDAVSAVGNIAQSTLAAVATGQIAPAAVGSTLGSEVKAAISTGVSNAVGTAVAKAIPDPTAQAAVQQEVAGALGPILDKI